MRLVDSHCHLMDLNAARAVERAQKKGVGCIVSNAMDWKSNQQNLELQKKFSSVLACFGLHPKECLEQSEKRNSETIEWMRKQFGQNGGAGIGETGLDYWIAKTTEQQKRQQHWFERQLELAVEFEKPVSIHCREAREKALEMVQKTGVKKALFHWFDGSKNELKELEKNGFLVSIGPAVFSQKKIQSIAAAVSLENLLLETDSPVQFNGKPAEPAWVLEVAQKIAEIRPESPETIALKTTENAEKFFRTKFNF